MADYKEYLLVRLKVSDNLFFIIHSSGVSEKALKDADSRGFLPFPEKSKRSPLLYSKDSGVEKVRLLENRLYKWRLESRENTPFPEGIEVRSSLEVNKGFWDSDFTELSGNIKSINYLGNVEITIKCDNSQGKSRAIGNIALEIIPTKLDYETEYRAMVEYIASRCQQLILRAGSPVYFNITHSKSKERAFLIEKYLFLRYILKTDRLELALELIGRSPDLCLKSEQGWKDFSHGGTADFYKNPLGHGRDWQKSSHPAGKMMANHLPNQISSSHRQESHDTPANRFIKYALESFVELCHHLVNQSKKGSAIKAEAKGMLEELETFQAQPLFNEVGSLDIIPHNSQVLQKREGYRDIYQAWLLLDNASRLDWEGCADIYEGYAKDAAVLYEYWLYFALHNILHSSKKYSLIKNESNFINERNGGLSITLKTGQTAKCTFKTKYASNNLKIQLFYNRKFTGGDEGTVVDEENSKKVFAEGSYTNDFRPDYTVALFPDKYATAKDAGNRVVYIHFDAKYRVDSYKEIHKNSDESDSDEKKLSFKRDDLNKMHIYNEAIRKTAGSYILYPGKDPTEKMNYKKYRELLPGVGAIAVKPAFAKNSGEPIISGAGAIDDFISQVVSFQRNRLNQSYRIGYHSDLAVEYPSPNYPDTALNMPLFDEPAMDNYIILGYIRREDLKVVEGEKKFFFHAVDREGELRPVDPNIYRANYFIAFTEPKDKTEQTTKGKFTFLKKIWKITSPPTLVKKEEIEKIRPKKEPSVELYYIITLDVTSATTSFTDISLAQFHALNPDVNEFSPRAVCWGELLSGLV